MSFFSSSDAPCDNMHFRYIPSTVITRHLPKITFWGCVFDDFVEAKCEMGGYGIQSPGNFRILFLEA